MDFELTKEQLDIQKAAREFAEAEFEKNRVTELDRNHQFPMEIWKKASSLGFIGLDIPEDYGGQGCGLLETVLVREEFSRCGAGAGISVLGTDFGAKIILRTGSEAQKRKYLPPLYKGEAISAGAFTEPDRGSDLVSGPLATNAVREGGDFIINGTKTFISFASIAKFSVVLCQTDPQSNPAYRGMSTIIVEMDRPGIEINEMEKLGWKTNPCCEVAYMNTTVPKENLIGEENRGFYQTIEFLDEIRIKVGATAVGLAEGAFQRAIQYAKKREAFGRKIASFQAISHKLAEMATYIEAARCLVYRAAWSFGVGKADPKLSSMAKWFPARVAIQVSDEAIEIMGGHGCMVENEVERFYRDARVLEIYEGTREIHKNTVARFLLGKLAEK
ncbi:MAG: acyl-CoA dehydrogenase family protein [Deltaproteobacteria bacterium]